MSKAKKQNSLYVIGFILVTIIAMGIYFSVYSKNSDNKNTLNKTTNTSATNPTSSDASVTAANDTLNFSGTIYYTREEDGHYELFSKGNNSEEKLLYTDSDENEKIKFVKSMTSSAKFLALIAPNDQNFGGSLYLIASDGSGNKEKIVDEFASPQPPIISSDEEKIAYILFSNAEMEYGFSLYAMSKNGENKVKIDTSSSMISNPVFDQNSKNIAYLKDNEIIISDIDGAKKNTIYTLDNGNQLESINWDIETNILISVNNSTETEIINIDPTNGDTKSIYKSNDILTSPVFVDSDENIIAFVNSQTKNIEIVDLNDNKKDLVNATEIIRWLK